MSELAIHGVTVSVDFGDKQFGNGNGRFMSASTKVPDDAVGKSPDQAMKDGLELYFTAWQTLMQTRCATGEISGTDYKLQTADFLLRIARIGEIYKAIKGMTPDELKAFAEKARSEKNQ